MYYNPERRKRVDPGGELPRHLRLNEWEQQLYDYLAPKTEAYKIIQDFQPFVGIYNREKLERDYRRLIEIRENFDYSAARPQLISNLLLYLIGNKGFLESSEPDRETYIDASHLYDDVMHGTDIIVTFHDEKKPDKPILLAIDTTSSQDTSRKKEKVDKDLLGGHLRKLEYYSNPATNQAVGPQEAIAITISYTENNLTKIAKKWITDGKTDSSFGRVGGYLDLELRNTILEQIDEQIAYCKYLEYFHSTQYIHPLDLQKKLEDLQRLEKKLNEARDLVYIPPQQ